jgi:hypothetical protein
VGLKQLHFARSGGRTPWLNQTVEGGDIDWPQTGTFRWPRAWAVAKHRYLSVESLAKVQMAVIENEEEVIPALAAASYLVNAAQASKVKTDLLADGQIELKAGAAGGSSAAGRGRFRQQAAEVAPGNR